MFPVLLAFLSACPETYPANLPCRNGVNLRGPPYFSGQTSPIFSPLPVPQCNSLIPYSNDLSLRGLISDPPPSGWYTYAVGPSVAPWILDAGVQFGPGSPGTSCYVSGSNVPVACPNIFTSSILHMPDFTQPGAQLYGQNFDGGVDGGLLRFSFWIMYAGAITGDSCPPTGIWGSTATLLFSYADTTWHTFQCSNNLCTDADAGIWRFCDALVTAVPGATGNVAFGNAAGDIIPGQSGGNFLITGVNLRFSDGGAHDSTAYTCSQGAL